MIFSSPTLCIAQGKALQNQGDYNSAGLWYKKAIKSGEKEQERALALANLGNLHRCKGDYDAAVSLLAESLPGLSQEEKGWALADMAAIHMSCGRAERPKESQVR